MLSTSAVLSRTSKRCLLHALFERLMTELSRDGNPRSATDRESVALLEREMIAGAAVCCFARCGIGRREGKF